MLDKIPVREIHSAKQKTAVWSNVSYGNYKIHDSVHDAYKRKLFPPPSTSSYIQSYSIDQEAGNLCLFKSRQCSHIFTRSPQIGFCVLELAKFKIQQLLNKLVTLDCRLLYTDTDSIFFQIPKISNRYLDTQQQWKAALKWLTATIPEHLDVSLSEAGDPLPPTKQPGLFSLDVDRPILELVALAPKSYALRMQDKSKVKHKGVHTGTSWLTFEYMLEKYMTKQAGSKETIPNVFQRKRHDIVIADLHKLGPGYRTDQQKFIYSGEPG